MNIYFAAALDTTTVRARNAHLTAQLEAAGYTVYLPQRDGGLFAQIVAGGMPPAEAAVQVYAADVAAIHACDVVVATFKDLQPDPGVAFEVGYGRAIGKRVILRPEGPHPINPMLRAAGTSIRLPLDVLLAALAGDLAP